MVPHVHGFSRYRGSFLLLGPDVSLQLMADSSQIPKPAEFGSCCDELEKAMSLPPNKMFWVSDDGVLWLSIGYVQSEDGLGWMDHAVLYCPFCGRSLQTAEEISLKAKPTTSSPQ